MDFKTVKDIDVTGKRILVRDDLNVPMDKDGSIRDDTRIRLSLPTIHNLIDRHARVILCSHLDRPRGMVVESLRLAPVARRLSELLGRPVSALDDCIGPDIEKDIKAMRDGDIVLLENLRFHRGEEENDSGFVRSLSRLADIYVNDAFGASHRSHASVVGITRSLPAVAGLLMEKELMALGKLLEDPARPFAAVIGGAKIEGKIGVLDHIIQKVDIIVVGGGLAATFLKSMGLRVGKSPVEEGMLQYVRDLMEKAKSFDVPLILPVDVVVSESLDGSAVSRTVPVSTIPANMAIADIGPMTIKEFTDALNECKTVFWNGPMGVFEVPPFDAGTRAMASTISRLDAVTVVGGGSTVEAVKALGLADKMTHVSSGGGATLEFLSGKRLPGVTALIEASRQAIERTV